MLAGIQSQIAGDLFAALETRHRTDGTVLAGVGPGRRLEYNPQTREVCAGIGIGPSAIHNVGAGPLTEGKMFDGRTSPSGANGMLSGGLNLRGLQFSVAYRCTRDG